ncbi:MAG: GNAT family N-acetyltransferase [Deltaproteobacteria bacterium]|nr:GNAT family N-acetyltransferase [Deltaproteobacteria bacterium]
MSDSESVSGKMREYYEQHGLAGAFVWFSGKVLKRLWRFVYQGVDYKLGICSLRDAPLSAAGNDADVLCRVMTRDDLEGIRQKFGESLSGAFSERLKHSTGYIVYCEGHVAGYAWSSSGLLENEGIKPFLVNLRPYEKTAYVYDCFTLPEYRNKKLFSRLLDYLLMDMKQKGLEKGFLTVRKDNFPMLKVIAKHGFAIEGEIKCRKYLFFKSISNDAFSKVCTVIP